MNAVDVVASVIISEGGGPGNSIHSWRCTVPERRGQCTCVRDLAAAIVAELARVIAARADSTLGPITDTPW